SRKCQPTTNRCSKTLQRLTRHRRVGRNDACLRIKEAEEDTSPKRQRGSHKPEAPARGEQHTSPKRQRGGSSTQARSAREGRRYRSLALRACVLLPPPNPTQRQRLKAKGPAS